MFFSFFSNQNQELVISDEIFTRLIEDKNIQSLIGQGIFTEDGIRSFLAVRPSTQIYLSMSDSQIINQNELRLKYVARKITESALRLPQKIANLIKEVACLCLSEEEKDFVTYINKHDPRQIADFISARLPGIEAEDLHSAEGLVLLEELVGKMEELSESEALTEELERGLMSSFSGLLEMIGDSEYTELVTNFIMDSLIDFAINKAQFNHLKDAFKEGTIDHSKLFDLLSIDSEPEADKALHNLYSELRVATEYTPEPSQSPSALLHF